METTITFYEGDGTTHVIIGAKQAFDILDAQKDAGKFPGEIVQFLSHTSYVGPMMEAVAECASMGSFMFQNTEDGALFLNKNGTVVGGYVNSYLEGQTTLPARGFAFIGG